MSEITLTRDQYLEFEKIGLGAFAPLQDFMNEDDFRSVVERMRLDDGRAIPNFITQALRGEPLTIFGSGQQTRSFCYVSDLVDGLHRLLTSNLHRPVNLGNPIEWTGLQMAEAIRNLTDSKLEFV